MELDELKLYLRIDGEEEDSLVAGLQTAAEEYLMNAGIAISYNKEIYKLIIKMLVALWYENRTMSDKEQKELPYGIKCLIQQMQFTQMEV